MKKATRIKALPGRAVIQLDDYWQGIEGSIIIPGAASVRKKTTGTVIDIVPTPNSTKYDFDEQISLVGKRVLVKPYAGCKPFDYGTLTNVSVFYVDDIEAIVEGVSDIKPSDGAVPRCKYCGPAKASISSNAMIMQDSAQGYYCPRCYKNERGVVIDPDKVTVSDGEVDQLQDRIDRSIEDEMRQGGQEPERKIISIASKGKTISKSR